MEKKMTQDNTNLCTWYWLRLKCFFSKLFKLKCKETYVHAITFRNYAPNGGAGGGSAVQSCQKILLPELNKQPVKYTFKEDNKYSINHKNELWDLFGAIEFVRQKTKNDRGAVYITHDYASAYALALLGRKYILVYHLQGPRVEEKINFGEKFSKTTTEIIQKCEKIAFQKAFYVCFPSDGAYDYFCNSKYTKLQPSDFIKGPTLYNTLYVDPTEEKIETIEKDTQTLTFLSVGQLTVAKGLDRHAELFKHILEISNKKIRYIYVGRGPLKNKISKDLKDLQNTFPGRFVSIYIESCTYAQMQYLQTICDIYLMLQRISIFDLATLELMRKKKCIVLSYVGGNKDFSKLNNIIFYNNSYRETAQKILESNIQNLGERNQEVYVRFFSKEKFISSYTEVLNDLLSSKRKEKNVKILTCYHRPAPVLKNECVIPIHVGRDLSDHSNPDVKYLLSNMIGDNTGENISKWNNLYCELTALYWGWKNQDKLGNPEYIGLMHYRRIFKFSPINNTNFTEWLNPKYIYEYCNGVDAILAEPKGAWSPQKRKWISTIREQFLIEHNEIDLRTVENALALKYPEMMNDYHQIMNSQKISWYNVCILKKDLYNEYCEFLFNILNLDLSKRLIKASRSLGYYSEALLPVFINYKIRTKNINLRFLPCENIRSENIKIYKKFFVTNIEENDGNTKRNYIKIGPICLYKTEFYLDEKTKKTRKYLFDWLFLYRRNDEDELYTSWLKKAILITKKNGETSMKIFGIKVFERNNINKEKDKNTKINYIDEIFKDDYQRLKLKKYIIDNGRDVVGDFIYHLTTTTWQECWNRDFLYKLLSYISSDKFVLDKQNKTVVLIYISLLIEHNNINEANKILKFYLNKFGANGIENYLYVSKLARTLGIKNEKINQAAMALDYFEKNDLSKLMSLMKNKTIAIVGNGPSDIGMSLGKEIDAHDIVVRINNYKINNYENDYGKKTNIWIRGAGAGDIISRDISEFKAVIWAVDFLHFPVMYDSLKDISTHRVQDLSNVFMLNDDIVCSLYEKSKCKFPTTGLLAIWLCLRAMPKCIDLYGFSFLQKDSINNNVAEHYFNDRPKSESVKRSESHNLVEESRFISSLINEGKRKIRL